MKFVFFAILTNSVFADVLKDPNDLFTSSAYKEILQASGQNEKNLLFSPFSVKTGLSLVQLGAKGETAEEIRTALHLPNDQNRIKNAFKNFLSSLFSDEYTLKTANKLYIKKDYVVRPEFQNVATLDFLAESENIDFSQTERAADSINQWVKKRTESKIVDLVKSADLNDRTRLVLINSLYFKGNWKNPFGSNLVGKDNFFVTPTDVRKVDTMHSNFEGGHYLYYECSKLNAKFLELQFKGDEASMTFVLPNEQQGLAGLENQMESVLSPRNLTLHHLRVALPKFKIERRVDFGEILENLGVRKVFTGSEADLSGIAEKKGDLIVDKVIQKSFIDVTETGVEATAATFISIPPPPSSLVLPQRTFIADHPFIFFIRVKNVTIFAGRFVQPDQ